MESRLTSGGMRFQADDLTAIDIHVHRSGEGRISFYPATYSMTKARTPKWRCEGPFTHAIFHAISVRF